MDEDPTTAGCVGDGNAQNEPDQTIQTASNEENSKTSNPTLSDHGAEPLTFGGHAPKRINREVDSKHVDHDLKLNTGEKKNHGPAIIIGIVLGVILLLFGGLAFWFFAIYSNPDKVAFDAVEHFFAAENVSMNGGFSLISQDEDSPFELAILQLESSSKSLPNSTKAILLVTPKDADESEAIRLELGTVQLSDGIAYIQLSGIMDAIEAAGLNEALAENILDLAEEVDNEWWQISVPDLLAHLEAPSDEADALNGIYTCAVNLASPENSNRLSQAAGDLYRSNKFVTVEPVKSITDASGAGESTPNSGYAYYEVGLDTVALASFINALPSTEIANEFYDCYNSAIADLGGDKINATDFDEVSSDDFEIPEDTHIYLEISKFSHELRSVTIEQGMDGTSFSGGILFTYATEAVEEPADYRPITDLIDEITELISELYPPITIDVDEEDE